MAKTSPRALASADPYHKPLSKQHALLTPAGAMAHNVARNFGVGSPNRKPAVLSCKQGEALYQGKCIPKSRTNGGTLAGPVAPPSAAEVVAHIAAQAHSKPAMYVVAPNDKTSTIAQKLGVSVASLVQANPGRPTIRLASGQTVFAALRENQKLNVPRRAQALAGGGTLGAGPGEPCGFTDWCDSGYHCEGGVCVADNTPPVQAGVPVQYGG